VSTVSAAVTASTVASAYPSHLVTRVAPAAGAAGSGARPSQRRPAMASAATTATSPALTMTTMPYAVLSSEPSGTRTSALTTPVAATTANSHTAALACSRTSPRIAAGSCRQATAARRVYSSIPAHITAGSRWVTDSRAPPTGTMLSGCARTASAAVTASSGSTLSPGRRSRRATAASANAAHSRPAISVWPVVSSGATVGCSRSASNACPLATTMASAAVAARPSSDERSAHGGGSGAGAVPRYCRARPRPARPPSAPASPASAVMGVVISCARRRSARPWLRQNAA